MHGSDGLGAILGPLIAPIMLAAMLIWMVLACIGLGFAWAVGRVRHGRLVPTSIRAEG
jgi:hypothetical protein